MYFEFTTMKIIPPNPINPRIKKKALCLDVKG